MLPARVRARRERWPSPFDIAPLVAEQGARVCVLASDIQENCEVIADAGFTFHQGSVTDLRRMLKRAGISPAER